MDEADGVMTFWPKYGVDGSVLDPCMQESKIELACGYKRDDKLLAQSGERLLMERP